MSQEASRNTNNPYDLHDPLPLTHEDLFFPFSNNNPHQYYSQTLQVGGGGFEPTTFNNNEFLHGSMDFNSLSRNLGFSPTSSEVFSSVIDGGNGGGERMEEEKDMVVATTAAASGDHHPGTPNTSTSSSSTEAGGPDDDSAGRSLEKSAKSSQSKDSDDHGGDDSKKGNKGKKKGEKREREPRFAFMTKSEVDHLEDGYRWRKYGQKAVKNSPYPRSYYRCTTQKCTVKKRVERSFEDPSIVITTYEGQHNHPVPATLRGHAAAFLPPYSMLASPSSTSSSFPQDFLAQLGHARGTTNTITRDASPFAQLPHLQQLQHHHNYQHQLQTNEYGLLQDVVPPFLFKQEP